jgi:RsiW-degrading membrane proteinase PrsW (M82 family)
VSIYLFVALAPALLLLWIFQKMDAKRPEPPGSVRNVVLLGVASCIPAAIIEIAISAILGDASKAYGRFLDAFLVAGTTEEVLKLACVVLYLWKKPHFDEVMDGILYTAAASLGFAMLENVLYVGNNLVIGLLRAFTAVPMHALVSGLMGYFVGRAKLSERGTAGWIAAGLAVGIGLHGLYDWALMSEGTFGFAEPSGAVAFGTIFAVLIATAIALALAYRHAHALDDNIHGPHSRPLRTEHAAGVGPSATVQPYAGMPVFVHAPDGHVYPARLLSGHGAHYLCVYPDGRQQWVPIVAVRAAQA